MKKIHCVYILFSIIFCFNSLSSQDNANKILAIVKSYSGKINITRNKQNVKAANSMKLYANDMIQTNKSSNIKILFKNAVEIKILEKTRILLNPLTGENSQNYSITQYSGSTMSNVKKLVSNSSYNINTPTTTAGVRGTEFTTLISIDGSTAVVVEKGKVEVSKVKQEDKTVEKAEETVTIDKGQKAIVTQEKDRVEVSAETSPSTFRQRWIQRRLNRFKRNYRRILRRASFRVRIISRRFNRGKRVLNRITNRVKRFDPRVKRILRSGRPGARRVIMRRTIMLRRRAFRIILRMRRLRRRLIAMNYIRTNIENALKQHESVKSTEFREFSANVKNRINEMNNTFPRIRKKIIQTRNIIREWKKLARENRGRGRFRRRRRFRNRFR